MPSAPSLASLASITMLSRVINFLRKGGVAIGTVSGRSQQPRRIIARIFSNVRAEVFFCRKVDGQDEQVSDGAQDR